MVNFLKFAKEYAAKHGMSYKEAVKSDKVKCAFHKEGKEKYCEETPTTQVNVYCNGGPTPEIEEEGPMGKKDLLPKKKVNFGDMPDQPPGGPMPPRRKAMPPRQIKKEDPNNIVMDLTNGFSDVPPVAPRKAEPAMPHQKFKTEDPPLIKPGTVPGKDDDVISVKKKPVKQEIIDLTKSNKFPIFNDDWIDITNSIQSIDDLPTLRKIEDEVRVSDHEDPNRPVSPDGPSPDGPDPNLNPTDPNKPSPTDPNKPSPTDPNKPSPDPEEDKKEDPETLKMLGQVSYTIIAGLGTVIYYAMKFGYNAEKKILEWIELYNTYKERYPSFFNIFTDILKIKLYDTGIMDLIYGKYEEYATWLTEQFSIWFAKEGVKKFTDATGINLTNKTKINVEKFANDTAQNVRKVGEVYIRLENGLERAGVNKGVTREGAKDLIKYFLKTSTGYIAWLYQQGYLSYIVTPEVAVGAGAFLAIQYPEEVGGFFGQFQLLPGGPFGYPGENKILLNAFGLPEGKWTEPGEYRDPNITMPRIAAPDGTIDEQREWWKEKGKEAVDYVMDRGIPGNLATAMDVDQFFVPPPDVTPDQLAEIAKRNAVEKAEAEAYLEYIPKKMYRNLFPDQTEIIEDARTRASDGKKKKPKAKIDTKRKVSNRIEVVNPWQTKEERAMAAIEEMQDPLYQYRQIGNYDFDPNKPVGTLFQNPNINPAYGATINGQPVMLPGDMNLLQGPQIGFGNGIGGRGLKRRKNIDELPQVVNFQLIL